MGVWRKKGGRSGRRESEVVDGAGVAAADAGFAGRRPSQELTMSFVSTLLGDRLT